VSTLIVTAHPDPGSLTHRAAARVAELLPAGTTETAHLAQEGFDPRFTEADRRAYLERRPAGPDVVAEQERVDRATDLVLVFPVWWWSMPALLKGWVDRVFIGGWAFGFDDADRVVPALGRLTAHLLPISGTAAESFARHGYAQSFSTQVEHGVLDYCGIRRGATAFLWESESGDEVAVARSLEAAATTIAAAVGQRG
jgi:NAD(P)H dehydrogenase (quinone)